MIPRKELTVSLGDEADKQDVIVREITPGMSLLLARAVMGDLADGADETEGAESERTSPQPGSKDRKRHVLAYLLGDVESRLRLLEACTSLQEHVRDLGGGDYLRLWQAFEEVNKDFFELLARRLAQSAAGLAKKDAVPQRN